MRGRRRASSSMARLGAAIVDADRPGPEQQGLVLFFTGLSGSGKSTLARALLDLVLEQDVPALGPTIGPYPGFAMKRGSLILLLLRTARTCCRRSRRV